MSIHRLHPLCGKQTQNILRVTGHIYCPGMLRRCFKWTSDEPAEQNSDYANIDNLKKEEREKKRGRTQLCKVLSLGSKGTWTKGRRSRIKTTVKNNGQRKTQKELISTELLGSSSFLTTGNTEKATPLLGKYMTITPDETIFNPRRFHICEFAFSLEFASKPQHQYQGILWSMENMQREKVWVIQ